MHFIVIEVPRAERPDKPVYIGIDPFKGSFRRNHEGDCHCKREEVLAMMRDQSIESADSKVIENLRLSDLNEESLQRYRNRFRIVKPDHAWNDLGKEEFLVRIGAAKRGEDKLIHPTLAGLLFFGDFMTIMDELTNYFLDYRERLATDTRWSDRVTSDVKKPFKLDQSLHRIDDTPVHAGLRESLANCLIHADYHGRCGIVIDKEFRKITTSNPGIFRISVEAAIAGGISDARNSRIFNMFSLIDVGERSGSGLCDIFHTWELNGYKRPVIIEKLEPDRTTLILEIDGNPSQNEGNREGNEGNISANEGNRSINNDSKSSMHLQKLL